MRKTLTALFVYLISAIVISLVLLILAERYIISLNQTSAINATSSKDNQNTTNILSLSKKVVLPQDVEIQYSYDNKYYTYLKDKKVYIYSLEDGSQKAVIEDNDSNGIVYFELLYDKNMILYFVENKGTSSSTLQLNTYNIDNGATREFNKLTVYNFSRVSSMHMSPINNMIYFSVEIKSGNATTNTVYCMDLFNSLYAVRSGVQVKDIKVLQLTDIVYYQYASGRVYYEYTQLTIFNEAVEMIGLDKNDYMYFRGLDSKNKIYKVKGTRLIDVIQLSDSDVVKTYSNNTDVYVVFPTYVVCVSANNPHFRVGRLTKYVEFLAIIGDKMYLKTNNNVFTMTDLLKE